MAKLVILSIISIILNICSGWTTTTSPYNYYYYTSTTTTWDIVDDDIGVIVIVVLVLVFVLVTSLCIWKCHCCTPIRRRIQGKCCPGQVTASSEGHGGGSHSEERTTLKEGGLGTEMTSGSRLLLSSGDLDLDEKEQWINLNEKFDDFEHTVNSKGIEVAVGEIASTCIAVATAAASQGVMSPALSKKLENAVVSGSWKKECRDEESVHNVIHENVFFGVHITKTVEKDFSECCGISSNKTRIAGSTKVVYMEAANASAMRQLQEMNARSSQRTLRYFDKLKAQKMRLSLDDGKRPPSKSKLKLHIVPSHSEQQTDYVETSVVEESLEESHLEK